MENEFWGEAILTATFLRNRLPSRATNNKTPYEKWFNNFPNLKNIKVFGCICFAKINNQTIKIGEKAEKCIFLGYESNRKAYKLLSLTTNKIISSRDVIFDENKFINDTNNNQQSEKDNYFLN